MAGVTVLRQLIGQMQGLCELYELPHPHPLLEDHISERCHPLGLINEKSGAGCLIIEIPEASESPPSKRLRENITDPSSIPPIMDHTIWEHLPNDLFEQVIARLPISSFFRLRSVCRKWNSLLCSRSFSDCCTDLPPPPPWIYVMTVANAATSYAVFDCVSRRWRHPPQPPPLPAEFHITVASAGGLVCRVDLALRKLSVTNPLTGSIRELPPRSTSPLSRFAVGMTSNGRDYKILLVRCDGHHEIYDSRYGVWSPLGEISDDVSRPIILNFRSPTVAIGQTVYFMRREPEGIVTYDAARGTWRQLGVPWPPHLEVAAIAECAERVLLVGLQRRNAATCVCVWELQRMTLLWKEVDRMPNVWCLEFYGRGVRMSCMGNRRVVMLALKSPQVSRLVTYDALTREWRRLPGRRKHWIGGGASFQPCLTASP